MATSATTPKDPGERFWSKVDVRGRNECWLWQATIVNSGYGRFWYQGKLELAHRVAYMICIGPIPEGMTIDHVRARGCTSRACVNPAHLEPVSRGENVMRGDTIPAANAAKTHCVNGHEFTPENTIIHRRNGRRYRACRQCETDRLALRYQASKETV